MQRPWVTSEAYEAAVAVVVDARRAAGLSQRDLAAKLGKPRSFVSKVENKERRLDIVEFIALAKALDVDPANLIDAVVAALPKQVVF